MKMKSVLVSGVFYTAVGKYIGVFISLIVSAILARFISPDDFGIFAIANVFLVFFSIIYDSGFSVAIVQQKDLSEEEISDIFSISVYISIIIASIFFLLSQLISDFYKNEYLVGICRILSINLLFSSLNTIPNSLFLKYKQFKFIAIRTISIQIILGIVSSISAVMGFGLYALLINPVFGAIILFLTNYIKYPIKFRINPNINTLKKIFSYSAFQFLFNFINYFSRNLDNLLIGKFMGVRSLGYYEKSYKLMLMPIQMITNVITPVMHPVFSDYSNDKNKLYQNYLKIIRILAGIGLPTSAFLFFSARELILLIFGSAWEPSVPVFRILAVSAGIQIILSSSGSIFQASGDTKNLFISGFLCAVTIISGMSVGVFVFKTMEATASFVSIAMIINFILGYFILIRITMKQSLRPFLLALVRPFLCTVCCVIGLFLYDKYFRGTLISSFFLKAVITGLIFVGINFRYLTNLVKARRK
jgi:PST family polysaccharide transporter